MEIQVTYDGTPYQFGIGMVMFGWRSDVAALPYRIELQSPLEIDTNPMVVELIGKEARIIRKENILTPEEEIERIEKRNMQIILRHQNDNAPDELFRKPYLSTEREANIRIQYQLRIRDLERSGWTETLADEFQPRLTMVAYSIRHSHSRILARASDKDWPKVGEWWEMVSGGLWQLGGIVGLAIDNQVSQPIIKSQSMAGTHSILPELPGDEIDRQIVEITELDPTITDGQLAQKIGTLCRTAVNQRRLKLRLQGYRVR